MFCVLCNEWLDTHTHTHTKKERKDEQVTCTRLPYHNGRDRFTPLYWLGLLGPYFACSSPKSPFKSSDVHSVTQGFYAVTIWVWIQTLNRDSKMWNFRCYDGFSWWTFSWLMLVLAKRNWKETAVSQNVWWRRIWNIKKRECKWIAL